MKVAAHPMVVAVAFGFLSPAALADEVDAKLAVQDCVDCSQSAADDALAYSDLSDAPSANDIARVEAEWVEVRGLV